ncbi:MAG: 50S ribosomal protein L11 methyltransferase [Deltaproteobacteria bacterium CG_4_8_14_3_um_filter_45_9]|nr:MAG: 50S ribosomal protein L11 methyltransferase [Deltaproteobacteria bacterium CG_4_8_14_3_um_filter_45_9]
MKRWLVVELLIPEEFGEAVSNFLIEQGATGIEELDGDLKWERLRTYFPQDGREERILHALHRYLKSLQKIAPEIPRAKIKTASLPEQDWGENWKRFFKPVQVTSRFVVKPPWSKIRLKRGQIPIEITPGMAFGTGTHATTILCIQALGEELQKRGLSVLDVGTGSGILSIIAAKSGAKAVWGIDIDGVAVENAKENVEKNQVLDIVKIRKGSIGDLHKKFNVVVANIDLKSLRRMRKPLLNHLKNQGFLILSGILEKEEERLREHYLKTGLLRWIKVVQREEWVCLTFKKK